MVRWQDRYQHHFCHRCYYRRDDQEIHTSEMSLINILAYKYTLLINSLVILSGNQGKVFVKLYLVPKEAEFNVEQHITKWTFGQKKLCYLKFTLIDIFSQRIV